MKLEKTNIPETGFVRIPTILKIFPIGKSTWWQGVKDGKFPKPIKIGVRTTAWKVEDIRALIEQYSNQ
jgi:prophage regulatory protein